jgi:penicillin amidase
MFMNDSHTKTIYRRRSWKKWLLRIIGIGSILLLAGGTWGYWQLRASLPILSGQLVSDRLQRNVEIERDAAGVPTIEAGNRLDAGFGLGFLHAQERFFQMDLLRRVPAGRLAELFGPAALENDKLFRRHRFEQVAQESWNRLSPMEQSLLNAYTDGVNFGLQKLGASPLEYQILRQTPQPWCPQDCLLAMFAMLCQLQDHQGNFKLAHGRLRESVPEEVFQFLCRTGGIDDAALDGSLIAEPKIPPAGIWSLRELGRQERVQGGEQGTRDVAQKKPGFSENPLFSNPFGDLNSDLAVGSNSFVVAGQLTGGGPALLASDMHLGLRVPATWYRAVIVSPPLSNDDPPTRHRSSSETSPSCRLVGVTLPGTPLLVSGSNGSIAWGFTNSYVDTGDVIELINDPTSSGKPPLESFREEIHYPGGKVDFEYQWSPWGPVVYQAGDRRFAYNWIGNRGEAFDLGLVRLETVVSTEEGLQTACNLGMPHQNIVIADLQGNVGWTITGRLPARESSPTLTPVRSDEPPRCWTNFLNPEHHPRQYNPPEGRIWTANNRLVGGEALELLGNGGYAIGHRARQIRQRLFERQNFTEHALLDIQLDDFGSFLSPWREWFLEGSRSAGKDQLTRLVDDCDLRSRVDSVGYRILHQFRMNVILEFQNEIERVLFTDRFPGPLPSLREDVIKQLLIERPEHWLPAKFPNWSEFLQQMVSETEKGLVVASGDLEQATWGSRNRVRIQHPMAAAVPWLGTVLNMPELELPGDGNVPRVQGPAFGASQRMVVAPGREEEGIYHQPGGQSGHPLSPYYRAGFEDWAKGHSSSLLPGPTRYRLALIPANRTD